MRDAAPERNRCCYPRTSEPRTTFAKDIREGFERKSPTRVRVRATRESFTVISSETGNGRCPVRRRGGAPEKL